MVQQLMFQFDSNSYEQNDKISKIIIMSKNTSSPFSSSSGCLGEGGIIDCTDVSRLQTDTNIIEKGKCKMNGMRERCDDGKEFIEGFNENN